MKVETFNFIFSSTRLNKFVLVELGNSMYDSGIIKMCHTHRILKKPVLKVEGSRDTNKYLV